MSLLTSRIWTAEKAVVQGSAQIKSDIEQAKQDLEAAHRTGDLARMSEIQYGVIPELEKRLEAAEGADQPQPTLLRSRVTEDEVAEVVSRWTGILYRKCLRVIEVVCCAWKRHSRSEWLGRMKQSR